MNKAVEVRFSTFAKSALFILGLAAMLVTWWLLSLYLAAWTEGILAPWDVDKRALPDMGTLPRAVNDFFEGHGWWVPAGLSLFFSAVCAFLRLWQTRFQQLNVPWEFAATNLLFGLVLFFMSYPAGALDNLWRQHFALPDVPHFYPLYITLSLLLWTAYILVQRCGFFHTFRQMETDN